MPVNKSKLFSGEVRVYLADTAEELPEFDDVAGTLLFDTTEGAWTEMFTSGDVILTHSKETEDQKVNGILAKIKTIKIGEAATVELMFSEYDFEIFSYVIGENVFTQTSAGADQVGRDNLATGNKQSLTEFHLALYGKDESNQYVLYDFPIVVSTGEFQKVLKHGHTQVKCVFDVLGDPENDGALWNAYKMTAEATS